MSEINIKVRKEVVLCRKCNKAIVFLYLSDFSYGERLITYNNGTKYAFINLFEDRVYSAYEESLVNILQKHNNEVSKEFLLDAMRKTFGITCDDVEGAPIEFNETSRRCEYCLSSDFCNSLVEPEMIVNIVLPIVSHEGWILLNNKEKEERMEIALRSEGLI